MDGKQLKNSILQWAIQGKLVPQNPKDEPASKLLERIAAIRHSEQSEESSKRSKKTSKTPTSRIYRENGIWYEQVGNAEPKDISDDIPFEIPENWAWCRLKDYLDVRDGTHDSPKYYSTGIPFVTSKNLVNGKIDFSDVKYISQEDHNLFSARSKVEDNDILFAMIGSIGNPVLVKKTCDFSIKNVALFKPYNEETNMHYMLLYFQFIQNGLKKIAAGGVQSFISLNVFRNWLFPLPPLAEQKRIVAKLEQVLPLADEYGAAQEELDKLNKELPEALKKSILQQAIQGKLIPQNPKDEPAQKLLERIAFCRHSEQSEESSKRSKKTTKNPTSRIYCENGAWYEQIGNAEPKDISDEIPFEIPESWAWCRLGDVFDHKNGKQLNTANKTGLPRKYITTSNLYWDHFVLDNLKTMYFTDDELDRCTAKKGDLLVCEGGDIGRAAIWNEDFDICIQNHIHKLRAYVDVCTKYFWNVLYYYKKTGMIGGKGIGIQGLSSKALHNIIIPLPPLAEQKRIVTKLEQLFKVL